ncbi:hypothetical protein [Nonomuraea fuscirosea]|uniref:hypothetical protein n=1 Tax=Nonomuraea fuscirosea TaxID=1291556 RepID=UPI00343C6995
MTTLEVFIGPVASHFACSIRLRSIHTSLCTAPAAPNWPSSLACPKPAELVAAAAPYAEQNTWAAASLARTRGILNDDHAALIEAVELRTSIDARFERARTQRLISGREQEGGSSGGEPVAQHAPGMAAVRSTTERACDAP